MLAICVLVLTFLSGANAECPDGWVTNADSCYLFDHSSLNFKEAEALCNQEYGHLVEIETSEEFTFLKNFAGFLKPTVYWIGLSDETLEHSWEWQTSNIVANYTAWYKGHPTNTRAKNCANILSSYGFAWFDAKCTNAYPAICERSRDYEGSPGLVGRK